MGPEKKKTKVNALAAVTPATPTLKPWPFSPKDVLAEFPENFTPRPMQEKAVQEINEGFKNGKRIAVLEMPTGGGKSFICLSFAEIAKSLGRTHFLTIQKTLQDQYTRDFPSPKLEALKGRSNYPCTLDPSRHCHKAPCTDRKKGILPECVTVKRKGVLYEAVQLQLHPDEHLCPYWKQLQKCHDHDITLFNFSSFLYQMRIGRFGKRGLMVIDEAHNIESQLMSFVTAELTEWALAIIGVEIDRSITTKAQLVEWLQEKEIQQKIDKALDSLNEDSSEDIPDDFSQAEADALKELGSKIENFLRYLDKTEWILETVKYTDKRDNERRKIVARPLYAKDFAQDLLFRHADRILVMSATILDVDVWASNLGLKHEEIQYVGTPCEFPAAHRPIHMDYAGNMGYKWFSPEQNPDSPTKPRFIEKIKQIITRHKGQRGIIHCHSFELSKILRNEVASDRFLFQEDFGGDKGLMLSMHETNPGSILVAPAMHEGFDLKDDLARFQVIAKVPWPSMKDKIVKERMSRDNRWYAWLTALKIVQSYGRAVRSKDDWATTYIIDSGFGRFFARNSRMLPVWFKEALRKYAPTKVTLA